MVYIDGMSQITPQGDGWYESPVHYGAGLHHASDPPYAGIVPSSVARRMSLLQKRAVATAIKAMDMAGLGMPDAIITATGAGTMKNSENFLLDMVTNGEEGLSPTPFINSTHNTLAATVAITLGCTGCNTTYSHNAMSFPVALMDSVIGLESGEYSSVLLSAHDELPEHYYRLLEEAGEFVGEPFVGEHSLSFVLRACRGERSLAAVHGVEIVSGLSEAVLREKAAHVCDSAPDLVITGDVAASKAVFGDAVPMYPYREIFGCGFSAPAAALYAAVVFLEKQPSLDAILLHDHYRHRQHSFVFVKRTAL